MSSAFSLRPATTRTDTPREPLKPPAAAAQPARNGVLPLAIRSALVGLAARRGPGHPLREAPAGDNSAPRSEPPHGRRVHARSGQVHAGPALGTHLLVGRSVPGHPHGGVVTRVPAHGMRLAGLKKGRHVSPCEPPARPGSACERSDSYPLPCARWVQVREISDAFDGRSTIPTAFRLVTPSRSRRVRSRPQVI